MDRQTTLPLAHVRGVINLAAPRDDCDGCYTTPGIVQCAMHSVTTSHYDPFMAVCQP